jgi:hypothetical protein
MASVDKLTVPASLGARMYRMSTARSHRVAAKRRDKALDEVLLRGLGSDHERVGHDRSLHSGFAPRVYSIRRSSLASS